MRKIRKWHGICTFQKTLRHTSIHNTSLSCHAKWQWKNRLSVWVKNDICCKFNHFAFWKTYALSKSILWSAHVVKNAKILNLQQISFLTQTDNLFFHRHFAWHDQDVLWIEVSYLQQKQTKVWLCLPKPL